MKREKLLNTIGLCLLGACFLVALLRVVGRDQAQETEGRTVIRFAHWQLEGGLRGAFDELARDYERLHPGVRVEQLAIPERTYTQWVKTQLIGGTAPDLIQLGKGSDEELIARHFTPLSDLVSRPNPYNVGTPLEGVPLRETILDGIASPPAYQANLIDHYGVPVSMFTVRMYYNRDLWRLVLGDTPTPRTYEDFKALFPRIEDYNRRTGRQLLPIAGSKANAPMLINTLIQNQTQRLVQERIAGATLRTTGPEIGLAFLRGDWSLEDPAFTDALHIARETGLRMQPGFLQLGREDATFYFVQGKALMITTGSWDSPSFRAQVNFELGVFPIPLPTRDHPRYGRNLFGPASEAEVGTGLALGVTRLSRDPARAADFLLYLASRPHNAKFSRLSGWLPSVVGVKPPAEIAPFLPIADGYVPGFDFTLGSIGANTTRTFENAANRLYSPQGSIESFRDTVRVGLPGAIEDDLRRNVRQLEFNIGRQDIALIAHLALQARHPDHATLAAKIDQIVESQHALDTARARTSAELEARAAAAK
jgi:raffinose/stachyose/melibiose transport system substrate-binding protein